MHSVAVDSNALCPPPPALSSASPPGDTNSVDCSPSDSLPLLQTCCPPVDADKSSPRTLPEYARVEYSHGDVASITEQLEEDAITDDYYEENDSMREGKWRLDEHSLDDRLADSKCDPSSPSSSTRPALVHRQSSYSKRHASVDTPREVPFPFPFLSHQSLLPPPHVSASITASSQPPFSPSLQHLRQPSQQEQPRPQRQQQDFPPLVRSSSQPSTDVIDGAGLAIRDHPPAYENMDEFRLGGGFTASIISPCPQPTTHLLIPYQSAVPSPPLTMDTVGDPSTNSGFATSDVSQVTSDAPDQPRPLDSSTATPVFPYGRPVSSPSSSSPPVVPPGRLQPADPSDPHWYDRSSSASLPLPLHTPLHTLPALRSRQMPESIAEAPTPLAVQPSQPPAHSHRPSQRQLSATRAMPALAQSNTAAFVAPPPPYSVHASPSFGLMNRSTSDYSPVVPARLRAAAASPNSTSHPLPPPAPPTILVPPMPGAGTPHRAPHESFLPDVPPPPDSWIAVETFPREYNLVVRLPGFRRDAITLATRRRRVLHLVADSWEVGGGHFERRISFGYDADLNQVRAEFDGELLRVVVPRRAPSTNWFGGMRE